MNDPMTILKADHREAKQLMAALAKTKEGKERNAMATELEKALSLHMALEEQYVYPLVARLVGAEQEEEAEIEHGLAREGLAKLVSMVEVPGFGAAVEMLKGGILHHVGEEETELLPSLKAAMDRSDWLALGGSLAKAKADAAAGLPAPAHKKSSKPAPGPQEVDGANLAICSLRDEAESRPAGSSMRPCCLRESRRRRDPVTPLFGEGLSGPYTATKPVRRSRR